MITFSRRNGYNRDAIQLEQVSEILKRRIFTIFYKREFDYYDTVEWTGYTTGIENMMIEMGVPMNFHKTKL